MSLQLRNPLKMLRSNAIALDMGSGHTRIATPEGETLLNEPTVVALEQGGVTVIVTGAEAKTYLGKAPDRIRVARPVEPAPLSIRGRARAAAPFVARVLPSDGTRIKACVVVARG